MGDTSEEASVIVLGASTSLSTISTFLSYSPTQPPKLEPSLPKSTRVRSNLPDHTPLPLSCHAPESSTSPGRGYGRTLVSLGQSLFLQVPLFCAGLEAARHDPTRQHRTRNGDIFITVISIAASIPETPASLHRIIIRYSPPSLAATSVVRTSVIRTVSLI